MRSDLPSVDDEDQMVLAMKAINQANPKVATYFYMNAYRDHPEMTRMARKLQENPEWALHDKDGNVVKINGNGYEVFDLSNQDLRQWWLKMCLDALSAANGDGCCCDMSGNPNTTFSNVDPRKMREWGEGMLQLTKDVQQQLGNDKLLIGKKPDQPYVKSASIEFFEATNRSINLLMEGVKNGTVMQAHVPITVDCKGDTTDYLAAFLIGAGKYCYYGCGKWFATGDDNSPWYWRPEYDYPLGEPVSPASYVSGVWKRTFDSGTEVMFDTFTNKGTIRWSKNF